MRQKVTENHVLSPQQEGAIAALLSGKSVTEAAEVAGVVRQTVHGWLRDDFVFQAAFNLGRRELEEAHSARLYALVGHAVAAVEKAVKEGDAKVALTVLRGVGLLPGTSVAVGSEDAEVLREEEEISRRREEKSWLMENMRSRW